MDAVGPQHSAPEQPAPEQPAPEQPAVTQSAASENVDLDVTDGDLGAEITGDGTAVDAPGTGPLPEDRDAGPRDATLAPGGRIIPDDGMAHTDPHHPGHNMIQLLTPEGVRYDHPDYPLDSSDDELRGLYRDLALVRRIDVEATALQRQGELGIWASLLGQEAAQIGSGRAMGDNDVAFPTYREHGVAWCKGIDPLELTGLYRGIDNGGWDPVEKKFNLYTIVIGAQTLHAVGYAMGMQRDGDDGAVIAYFGDGASSQGDVSEAFIFSTVFDAPVVFFCQNNQYAISEPFSKQSRVPIYRRPDGFGFKGIRVDGNDVLAVLAVTRHALEEARSGNGPVLIEAYTYRMGAHTTNDDPSRYRLASEVEEWKLKDPVERMKAYLVRTGKADHDFFVSVEKDSDDLAARLRQGTLAMQSPDISQLFDHVYAEQTELVAEQKRTFTEYHASFAHEGGR